MNEYDLSDAVTGLMGHDGSAQISDKVYDRCCYCYIQVAQLSQRDRAAGWVSYGQKWKTVNWRQHFTDIIGLSSTTMT